MAVFKQEPNKKEMNKHLIRVQPCSLSALGSWMNRGCPHSLALVGEHHVLHKQAPHINLRGSCLFCPSARKASLHAQRTQVIERLLPHAAQHTQMHCTKHRAVQTLLLGVLSHPWPADHGHC